MVDAASKSGSLFPSSFSHDVSFTTLSARLVFGRSAVADLLPWRFQNSPRQEDFLNEP
jgi:hypothetical protein